MQVIIFVKTEIDELDLAVEPEERGYGACWCPDTQTMGSVFAKTGPR